MAFVFLQPPMTNLKPKWALMTAMLPELWPEQLFLSHFFLSSKKLQAANTNTRPFVFKSGFHSSLLHVSVICQNLPCFYVHPVEIEWCQIYKHENGFPSIRWCKDRSNYQSNLSFWSCAYVLRSATNETRNNIRRLKKRRWKQW